MARLNNHLPTLYQEFIHLSRYSRWLEDKGRRETWGETIDRYFNFFEEHLMEMHDYKLDSKLRTRLEEAVLECKIMPSMRCLMTAGEALKRENIAGYNCSYVAVNRVQAFDEILYVLMNGTGVGFSVERQEVSQLPVVGQLAPVILVFIISSIMMAGISRSVKNVEKSEGDFRYLHVQLHTPPCPPSHTPYSRFGLLLHAFSPSHCSPMSKIMRKVLHSTVPKTVSSNSVATTSIRSPHCSGGASGGHNC